MSIINQQITAFRERLIAIFGQLHRLTVRVEHEEMMEIAEDVKQSINDPFLFVIVGEVKVGKSSFINALLDSQEEICKVAPHPMTDTIQVINHGSEVSEKSISPYLKHLTHPADILKEVSVVDTPGTNTIIDRHQEITEEFIPNSDLVIFVFEAKNPYRQSAWDFFRFIQKDWHKKLVFVLQQKDLMSQEDLITNIEGVRKYAQNQGIDQPEIFAVSALEELKGNHQESGFEELKVFIQDRITGGQAPVLKMLSKINTAQQVSERLAKGIDDRQEQLKSDEAFREDISSSLDEYQRLTRNQVNNLVENILDSYDKTTIKVRAELNEGLGFFSILKKSISSIFDKEQNPKNWLEGLTRELETSLNVNMKEKLGRGVRDISDSLQQMAHMAQIKIQQSETILKNDHDVFSSIADRRARVLQDLQEAFDEFLGRTENFYPEDMLRGGDRLSPNVATGTGVAVLGAMLTALTNGVVFDVTGGVLTAVGLIFAGASLGFQKRKLLRRYQSEVAKGREKLESRVAERLLDYVHHIREKIDHTFSHFDRHLENEKKEINSLLNEQATIIEDLSNIKHEIETTTNVTL